MPTRIRWICLTLLICSWASADTVVIADRSTAQPAVSSGSLGTEPIRGSEDLNALPASPAASPQTPGMDYTRVVAALGLVIVLIFVFRWFGRFIFPATAGRSAGRAVEVISRSPLSPKQQVMLLRVGHRLIVVGDSGSQMSPLCEITDPDEVALLVGQLRDEKTSAPARAFGAMFRRSRNQFNPADDVHLEPQSDPNNAGVRHEPMMAAREELSGLRDRVRLLAEQFKGA